MYNKKKRCKPTGKAKNFDSCGNLEYIKRYGMCSKCYREFLLNTPEGNKILVKGQMTGKKKTEKERKKRERERMGVMRKNLETKSDIENRLQKKINKLVRLIDLGHACISSNTSILGKKHDAGHYYSVGSTPTLRFNLHNIFSQSVSQNKEKGGNPIDYIANIKRLFGEDYAQELECMRSKYPIIKLSKEELEECISHTEESIKYVKLQRESKFKSSGIEIFSLKERISLRDKCNEIIGIYK